MVFRRRELERDPRCSLPPVLRPRPPRWSPPRVGRDQARYPVRSSTTVPLVPRRRRALTLGPQLPTSRSPIRVGSMEANGVGGVWVVLFTWLFCWGKLGGLFFCDYSKDGLTALRVLVGALRRLLDDEAFVRIFPDVGDRCRRFAVICPDLGTGP